MDINELTKIIAREVLKELKDKPQKESALILDKRRNVDEKEILKLMGEDMELYFLDDDSGEKCHLLHIIPKLSCEMMAELASGNAVKPAASKILRLLLSGKEVVTFEFEYKSYGKTAPFPLYELYESYEKRLFSYGLKEFTRKDPETLRVRKNLVTEKDVTEAEKIGASTLWISGNAICTPLALESAKELGIKFLKR